MGLHHIIFLMLGNGVWDRYSRRLRRFHL